MSIRLRLTLWYSILLAVTLLALGSSIYLFVNYNVYNDMKKTIKSQTDQIRIVPSINFMDQLDLNGHLNIEYEGMYIQIVNFANNNIVITQTPNLIRTGLTFPTPEVPGKLKEGFVNYKVKGKYNFLAYQKAVRLKDANHTVIGLVQVAKYTDSEVKMLEGLRSILIFSSAAVLLIAFTTGLIIARQALRPIENVIRATNQIENGTNLSIRIPREGPNDEIGRLTDTLNGMLMRLETTYNELNETYKTQRRFVSDASHELRTPLTTIRGNIDLLEKMWQPHLTAGGADERQGGVLLDPEHVTISREAMHDISDEAKRMSRLVADLLSLARADAGYEMEKTPVPLLEIVEEVTRRAQHLPRTADWIVGDLSPLQDAVVQGNPDYLRQLIFIFIENAFKYTPSGYVELYGIRTDTQAGLVIKDTGIGMDKEEIPQIFERFYRADVSRGKTAGTGLGLSIAKWIIDAHGGSVEVKTREGEGTSFVIWLPVSFSRQMESGIMGRTDRKNG